MLYAIWWVSRASRRGGIVVEAKRHLIAVALNAIACNRDRGCCRNRLIQPNACDRRTAVCPSCVRASMTLAARSYDSSGTRRESLAKASGLAPAYRSNVTKGRQQRRTEGTVVAVPSKGISLPTVPDPDMRGFEQLGEQMIVAGDRL